MTPVTEEPFLAGECEAKGGEASRHAVTAWQAMVGVYTPAVQRQEKEKLERVRQRGVLQLGECLQFPQGIKGCSAFCKTGP